MLLTIRLLLVMSILPNLQTSQIDYSAAFLHAFINCIIYVEMPKSFSILWFKKKNPRNLFLYNEGKLKDIGFYQAKDDPFLFVYQC